MFEMLIAVIGWSPEAAIVILAFLLFQTRKDVKQLKEAKSAATSGGKLKMPSKVKEE